MEEGSGVNKGSMVKNGSGMDNRSGNTDGVDNGLHSPHNGNGLNGPHDWDGVVNDWGGSDEGGPGVGVVGWSVDGPHNWSWGYRNDGPVKGDDAGSRGSVVEGGSIGSGDDGGPVVVRNDIGSVNHSGGSVHDWSNSNGC